jgi:hypothetical protein
MHSLLFGAVVIVQILAATTASLAAQSGDMKNSYRYSGCFCHFGYGIVACNPDVSCASEGGRCGESCVLPRERDYSTRG